MAFEIDPRELNLQDAAGMQLVELLRRTIAEIEEIEAAGIFWAERNTTTYSELAAAYNNGKPIFMKDLGLIYCMSRKGTDYFLFTSIIEGMVDTDEIAISYIPCDDTDGWGSQEIRSVATATDEQVAEAVDTWLDENVAQETGYVLDSSLTLSNAAAPADKVGELKSKLDTKIGFVNLDNYTMFETGNAVYNGSSVATTRRWFVNHVFHTGTNIKNIKFGATANSANPDRTQYFEIWTKNGNTLTKVKTVEVSVVQAQATQTVAYFTAEINYWANSDCMVCLKTSGSPSSMLYITDPDGNDNLLVSTDVDMDTDTLLYSSLDTFSIKILPDMQISYSIGTKVNVVFIGPGMDYEEIQDALTDINDDSATNPYTLLVTPKGVPYKPFSMLRDSFSDAYPWSGVTPRNISIVGIDKANCVIESDSGDYALPCGELLTNGIVKNLTFKMTNNAQTETATRGGYCLHIDSRPADNVGYKAVIEDCDFENASGPCIGAGIHQDCNLIFRRCHFHTTLASNYAPHEGYVNLYDYGCFFAHTSTVSGATGQHLTLEDCVGLCESGDKSLRVNATAEFNPPSAVFIYSLFRNIFWNTSQAGAAYSISSSLTADPMNFGNNIPTE